MVLGGLKSWMRAVTINIAYVSSAINSPKWLKRITRRIDSSMDTNCYQVMIVQDDLDCLSAVVTIWSHIPYNEVPPLAVQLSRALTSRHGSFKMQTKQRKLHVYFIRAFASGRKSAVEYMLRREDVKQEATRTRVRHGIVRASS